MRPRRYRLRCYVFGVRSILWALDRLSDWEVRAYTRRLDTRNPVPLDTPRGDRRRFDRRPTASPTKTENVAGAVPVATSRWSVGVAVRR